MAEVTVTGGWVGGGGLKSGASNLRGPEANRSKSGWDAGSVGYCRIQGDVDARSLDGVQAQGVTQGEGVYRAGDKVLGKEGFLEASMWDGQSQEHTVLNKKVCMSPKMGSPRGQGARWSCGP